MAASSPSCLSLRLRTTGGDAQRADARRAGAKDAASAGFGYMVQQVHSAKAWLQLELSLAFNSNFVAPMVYPAS